MVSVRGYCRASGLAGDSVHLTKLGRFCDARDVLLDEGKMRISMNKITTFTAAVVLILATLFGITTATANATPATTPAQGYGVGYGILEARQLCYAQNVDVRWTPGGPPTGRLVWQWQWVYVVDHRDGVWWQISSPYPGYVLAMYFC